MVPITWGPLNRGRQSWRPAAYKQALKSYRVSHPHSRRGRVHRAGFRRFSKKGVDEEIKFFDQTFDDVTVASGGVISGTLVQIRIGTGESQRIGRKIHLHSVTSNIHVTLPTTVNAAATHDTLMIYLLLDKQSNGALPTAAQIKTDPSNSLTFNNLQNTERFVTLWKRTITLNATAGSGQGTTSNLSYGTTSMDLQVHKKLNLDIYYDADAGTITDLSSNNLVFYLQCRHGLMLMNTLTRVRFTG